MEYRGENKTSRIKKPKPWNFQVLHLEGIMCLFTVCCLFYFCISHFKALFLHNNHTLLFLLMWRVRPLLQSVFYAPSIHEVLFIRPGYCACKNIHSLSCSFAPAGLTAPLLTQPVFLQRGREQGGPKRMLRFSKQPFSWSKLRTNTNHFGIST